MEVEVMEIEEAARCLVYMKRKSLDKKTARKLRDLIEKADIYKYFGIRLNHPISLFPRPAPRPFHQRKRKEIVKENINQRDAGNGNRNNKLGVFEADPEFVRKLESNEISLTKLPPLGHAIDQIVLPRLPPIESLQGQISNCSSPFEKQLTMSDLNTGQARLAFSGESVRSILKKDMKESEYAKVIDTNLEGLKVTVYDRTGRGYEMRFKLWSGKMHILTQGWKEFCSDNQFEVSLDWVTIWMFRHRETQKICFAIVARRFPTENLIGKTQKNGNKNKKQKM